MATFGMRSRPCRYASINTSEVLGSLRRRRFDLYRLLLRYADTVIFGCQAQREDWQRRFGRGRPRAATAVIYNGIDTAHFDGAITEPNPWVLKRRYGISDQEMVLGTVAQLRPEKGHRFLLRACKALIDRGHRVRLLLVGDGPERDAIKSEVLALRIEGNVVMVGECEDVRPWLSVLDVFVLPSVAVEVFSNAALEAMSMGKAIVLSDIGGAKEMVEPGENGFVVPPGDSTALANTIERIVTRRAWKEMGQAARRTVTARFATQDMIQSYERLLFVDGSGTPPTAQRVLKPSPEGEVL
jgi:glycosyltransferase involved in cell wall biosynthesis